jgi:predicted alpha/beta hydrolase
MDVQITKLQIPARDGFTLSALEITPVHGHIAGLIQVNPATAVKKEFYLPFCTWLAEEGYKVIVFDYRGIGGSRPAGLRGFKTCMHEWATLDINGVCDYVVVRYPTLPKYWVGHSFGTHLAGLIDHWAAYEQYFSISTGTGYWRWFRWPHNAISLFYWKIFIPVTGIFWGAIPNKLIGFGENLPTGVAKEWGAWCRNPNHYQQWLQETKGFSRFEHFNKPFHTIFPDDDPYVNDRTVKRFLKFYPAAQHKIHKIDVAATGLKIIGHTGFFRRRCKDILWPLVIDRIEGNY